MRRVTWLGHATVLIETAGVRLVCDPVLRSRVAHLRRHAQAPPRSLRVDGVLISHVHHDHLDRPSLRACAGPATRALVPTGAASLVPGDTFADVLELAPGDRAEVGAAEILAVPAWHPARRRPGAPLLDALGFLVDRVWFAGDTDLHDDMRRLRGRVDVALMPIWGWGTSLGPGHLDPPRAAQAIALVRPQVVVPIHWGTFLPFGLHRRHARVLTEPAVALAAHAERLAPEVRVATLAPGESLELSV